MTPPSGQCGHLTLAQGGNTMPLSCIPGLGDPGTHKLSPASETGRLTSESYARRGDLCAGGG
jgi:hypothetical protein